MSNSKVESLGDEELLMYYETTKKFLDSRLNDESIPSEKINNLQQRVLYIEEEIKSRSLWEGE